MKLFLSNFEKKVDKKGRLLIPSSFRAVLVSEDFSGVVAYPSFIKPCIEICSMSRIERLTSQIDLLDPFSEEYDAFASTILGSSVPLPFDKDGRIMFPENMLTEIGINDGQVVLVGKGHSFELWQPEEYSANASLAKKTAREKRMSLRAGSSDGGAGNG